MKIDKHLHQLPLTKTNPDFLEQFFGNKEIIPMWVADMEFETAKPIQEAMIERIQDLGFGYEYRPESYFRAMNKWYSSHYDLILQKEEIIFSPSITTSLAFILEAFTDKNDSIILQPPVFMEFRDVIRKVRRKIVKNPLKLEKNRYSIDFKDLEEKAGLEETKAMILCNPHNPVGRVWTPQEIENIVKICKENNVLLISDEIHKDIILFGNTFTSVLQFAGLYENIIVCTSEAKTFNLPGISDSMLIFPDKEKRNILKNAFKKYNLGRTNALTRIALEAAYNEGDNWLKELIFYIEDNVNLILFELERSHSKIRLIKPEGTYQVWLDFREIFDDSKKMFSFVTQNSGIGMNAGHWFGREGALFMRMNIATSRDQVVEAIQKIIKVVSQI